MRMDRVGAAAIALVSFLSACSSPSSEGAPAKSASIENSCINPTDITGQTIVSDQEIRFELKNRETWVNKLPRACPGLKLSGGFTWSIHGTLACSNQERIVVKETGTPCLIGEFNRVPSSAS